MRRSRTPRLDGGPATALTVVVVASVAIAAAALAMGVLAFFVPPFRFGLEAGQAAQDVRLDAAEAALGDAVLRCDGSAPSDLDIVRWNASAACWQPAVLPPDLDVVNRLCANQTLATGDLVVYDAAGDCYLAIPPASDPVNVCAGEVPAGGDVLWYDGGSGCYRTAASLALLEAWACALPIPAGSVLAWNGTCLDAVPLADLDQSGALANATLRLDGLIAGLDARVAAAEANITSLSDALAADVAALEGEVAALGGRLDAAEGNLTAAQADLAALDGRLAAAEGNLTALDGRVSAAEGDVASLDGRLSAAEGQLASLDAVTPLAYLQTVYNVSAEAAYSPSATYASAPQTVFNEDNAAADALLVLSITWADPLPAHMPPVVRVLCDPGGGVDIPNDPHFDLVPRAGETKTVYMVSQLNARATNGDELVGGPGGPAASGSWLVSSPWRATAVVFSLPETHFNVDAFRWVLSDLPTGFYDDFAISFYNRP